MVRPCRRGRAQYLPGAKTVLHGAFPYDAHLSLGGDMLWEGDSSSNFDLSVCHERGTRFIIIGRRLYLRLPLLRGGSRVAGGEDEKN